MRNMEALLPEHAYTYSQIVYHQQGKIDFLEEERWLSIINTCPQAIPPQDKLMAQIQDHPKTPGLLYAFINVDITNKTPMYATSGQYADGYRRCRFTSCVALIWRTYSTGLPNTFQALYHFALYQNRFTTIGNHHRENVGVVIFCCTYERWFPFQRCFGVGIRVASEIVGYQPPCIFPQRIFARSYTPRCRQAALKRWSWLMIHAAG